MSDLPRLAHFEQIDLLKRFQRGVENNVEMSDAEEYMYKSIELTLRMVSSWELPRLRPDILTAQV